MNSELFLEYLQNPVRLHRLPYQELKSLVMHYPYCQNLRYLLFRKSDMEKHPELSRNFNLAAIYAPDRTHLFNLVKKYRQQIDKQLDSLDLLPLQQFENEEHLLLDLSKWAIGVEQEVTVEQTDILEQAVSLDFSNDTFVPVITPETIENRVEIAPPHLGVVMQSLTPIDHLPLLNSFAINAMVEAWARRKAAAEVTGGETKVSLHHLPPLVDNFILNEYVTNMLSRMEEEAAIDREIELALSDLVAQQQKEKARNIPLEITNEAPFLNPEVPESAEVKVLEEEKDIINNDNVQKNDAEIFIQEKIALSHAKLTEEHILPKNIPTHTPEAKISFSSWLKQQKAPTPRDGKTPYLQVNAVVKAKESDKKPKKKHKKDKALKKLLKTKHEAQEKHPSREKKYIIAYANESLRMGAEIASETLARILVQQEQFAEAVKMYERLCLQYPEKSRYFAAEIEKIKNQ